MQSRPPPGRLGTHQGRGAGPAALPSPTAQRPACASRGGGPRPAAARPHSRRPIPRAGHHRGDGRWPQLEAPCRSRGGQPPRRRTPRRPSGYTRSSARAPPPGPGEPHSARSGAAPAARQGGDGSGRPARRWGRRSSPRRPPSTRRRRRSDRPWRTISSLPVAPGSRSHSVGASVPSGAWCPSGVGPQRLRRPESIRSARRARSRCCPLRCGADHQLSSRAAQPPRDLQIATPSARALLRLVDARHVEAEP